MIDRDSSHRSENNNHVRFTFIVEGSNDLRYNPPQTKNQPREEEHSKRNGSVSDGWLVLLIVLDCIMFTAFAVLLILWLVRENLAQTVFISLGAAFLAVLPPFFYSMRAMIAPLAARHGHDWTGVFRKLDVIVNLLALCGAVATVLGLMQQ